MSIKQRHRLSVMQTNRKASRQTENYKWDKRKKKATKEEERQKKREEAERKARRGEIDPTHEFTFQVPIFSS